MSRRLRHGNRNIHGNGTSRAKRTGEQPEVTKTDLSISIQVDLSRRYGRRFSKEAAESEKIRATKPLPSKSDVGGLAPRTGFTSYEWRLVRRQIQFGAPEL